MRSEEVSDTHRLKELRAEVARLEAALESGHQASSASHPQPPHPPHDLMRQADAEPMKRMGMKSIQRIKMMGGKIRMMNIDNVDSKSMASALPGFPGVSHLYHIGATGFFLDHHEHLDLTTEQHKKLRLIANEAEQTVEGLQRKVDAGEKNLFDLTGADLPDIQKIKVQIEELEKWRSEQRLAFIRSVGFAVQTLTPSQRSALVGETHTQDHSSSDGGEHQHQFSPPREERNPKR